MPTCFEPPVFKDVRLSVSRVPGRGHQGSGVGLGPLVVQAECYVPHQLPRVFALRDVEHDAALAAW